MLMLCLSYDMIADTFGDIWLPFQVFAYLLRLVLKVTTLLGRNFHLRVPELVPISSRAKSNNIDVKE